MWTGEWWNRNVVDVESDALLAGQLPAQSDAFTVNGKTGLLYPCASTFICSNIVKFSAWNVISN